MSMDVGKMDVRGTEVEVTVDEHGIFHATLGQASFAAETYKSLHERLITASRRAAVKVSVPFTTLIRDRLSDSKHVIRNGTATGIHATTREILVRWDDGSAGKLRGYSYDVMERLDADETATLASMITASDEARDSLLAFMAARKLSIHRVITEAQEGRLRRAKM